MPIPASSPLDAGGTTEAERELIRRKIKAAIPLAVSTFAVPTTALLKAGQLGVPKIPPRRKKVITTTITAAMTAMPIQPQAVFGNAPLQSARTVGYAVQTATAIHQAIETRVAPTPTPTISQAAQNAAIERAATAGALPVSPTQSTLPVGLERYPGQFAEVSPISKAAAKGIWPAVTPK